MFRELSIKETPQPNGRSLCTSTKQARAGRHEMNLSLLKMCCGTSQAATGKAGFPDCCAPLRHGCSASDLASCKSTLKSAVHGPGECTSATHRGNLTASRLLTLAWPRPNCYSQTIFLLSPSFLVLKLNKTSFRKGKEGRERKVGRKKG